MLDIKFIRNNPDVVKKDLQKRNDLEKIDWLNDLLKKDGEYRELLQENQQLRAKRNTITEDINQLRKQGKDISAKVKEAKELPEEIRETDEKIAILKDKIDHYLMRIPNILHE